MTPSAVIDLSGAPAAPPDGAVRLMMDSCRVVGSDRRPWEPTPPWGIDDLRNALSGELGCSPDELAITSGVRSTVPCLAPWLRTVVVERPSFSGIPVLLRQLGCTVLRAPWEELAEHADMPVWCTHPARNPDGRSLTRNQIDQMTTRSALTVVNEVYQWHASPPAAATLPLSWARVGSFAKLIGPRARLGWIRGQVVNDLDKHALRAVGPDPLIQMMWSRFITAGGLELYRHRAAQAAQRRALFLHAAATLSVRPGPDGSSVLIDCPPGLTSSAASERLLQAGVRVGQGTDFDAEGAAVRLAFDGIGDADALNAAAVIVNVFSEPPVAPDWPSP